MERDTKYTIVGTDIEEVKRLNAQSGLSYNEVKARLSQTGGSGTSIYSNTNAKQVRKRLSKKG